MRYRQVSWAIIPPKLLVLGPFVPFNPTVQPSTVHPRDLQRYRRRGLYLPFAPPGATAPGSHNSRFRFPSASASLPPCPSASCRPGLRGGADPGARQVPLSRPASPRGPCGTPPPPTCPHLPPPSPTFPRHCWA